MKKVFAVNVCVLMIMFMTAGMIAKPDTLEEKMEKLISSRIEILNSYYSGSAGFDETRDQLAQVEKGPLLKNDTILMKEYAATDIEQIPSHRVKVSSCRGTGFGIIKGKTRIQYVMEGETGKKREKHWYSFTAEKGMGKVKLTNLKNI